MEKENVKGTGLLVVDGKTFNIHKGPSRGQIFNIRNYGANWNTGYNEPQEFADFEVTAEGKEIVCTVEREYFRSVCHGDNGRSVFELEGECFIGSQPKKFKTINYCPAS